MILHLLFPLLFSYLLFVNYLLWLHCPIFFFLLLLLFWSLFLLSVLLKFNWEMSVFSEQIVMLLCDVKNVALLLHSFTMLWFIMFLLLTILLLTLFFNLLIVWLNCCYYNYYYFRCYYYCWYNILSYCC